MQENSCLDKKSQGNLPEHYEARNRVLLYTRGIPESPVQTVAIALESLQKANAIPSDRASIEHCMTTLDGILQEKNIKFEIYDEDNNLLQSTPPLSRSTMLPEGFELNFWQRICGLFSKKKSKSTSKTNDKTAWERVVARRRLLLTPLTLLPSILAGLVLYSLFADTSWQPLLWLSVVLFTVLFYWISLGFWSFMVGIAIMLRKYDKFSFKQSVSEDVPLPDDARTALLFPIYNEDATTVCAGIRTVWQSLCAANIENHFNIFILSDSTQPDAWVNEEQAWHELCLSENAHKSIFYRHRRLNLKRKSGNIADFCRRWGKEYRYMVVFDADSLMSAHSLKRMVQIMEQNPDVGIVQSPPKVIKSGSLLSRVQQFANHLYGPVFAAGLNFWRLGNTQYWGHNAIIRVHPFMQHCQLPKLSGRAPLGGEILSHDFVESALMRRAGYGVWLAYDLEGSYEQTPPSLIDELIRDRRWCQGNLQHSRLLLTRGFFPTHRALFINGIMSYVSALLWLFFLLASSAQVVLDLFMVPEYFTAELSLFPKWPQYFPHWLLTLVSCTAALLFLPKICVICLVQIKGGAKAFGGLLMMTLSVLCEVIVSSLLAPVRMLFHSWFVISSLLGRTVSWNSQNREDTGTSWRDALKFHWWGTVLGGLWGWFMYLTNPQFFIWFSPVAFGLVFSIPLSVWTSKLSIGNFAHKLGLFLTPPDTQPCVELKNLEKNIQDTTSCNPFDLSLNVPKDAGFVRSVIIHANLSLHASLNRQRKKDVSALYPIIEKALIHGPNALTRSEKTLLLQNPKAMIALHRKIWAADTKCASRWGILS